MQILQWNIISISKVQENNLEKQH